MVWCWTGDIVESNDGTVYWRMSTSFCIDALILIVYCQTSNISGTKYQNFNVSRFVLQLSYAQSTEARCYVDNEDVVGAAPTGICMIKNHIAY